MRARVSGPTSAENRPGPRSTTVRHTPFTPMLAPMGTSATGNEVATTNRRVSAPAPNAMISPSPFTIPVNI